MTIGMKEEKRMSLLSKAKAQSNRKIIKPVSAEEVELIVAWAKGEVSNVQVIRALKCSQSQLYTMCSRVLVQLAIDGKIKE
jgi:hypothetical protein